MIDVCFTSASVMRVSVAVIFTAAAFFAVLSIEHQTTPNSDQTSVQDPLIVAAAEKKLILETTYPVVRWQVLLNGKDITATSSSAQRFEAMIKGDLSQCFVQAESTDMLNATAVALRWHYNGQSGIIWGEGFVAGNLSNGTP